MDDLPFYAAFEVTAAKAAAFELRARLVADLSPHTSGLSTKATLDKILSELKIFHGEALSLNEWEHLELVRKIRNKLYHGELHKAVELVGAPSGGVFAIDLPSESDGVAILNQIEKLISGEGRSVAGTTTTDSGVFGWLLESFKSGALQMMEEMFVEAQVCTSKLANFINATK